jgi:hypothetical protein
MLTTDLIQLISADKALVEMERGCAWVNLESDGERVGFAFTGPSRYAVDAIAETEKGAIGESWSGYLSGVQIFLGTSEIERYSSEASDAELESHGFSESAQFLEKVEAAIHDKVNGNSSKVKIDEGQVLVGSDINKKSVILAVNNGKIAFVHGKNVFALSDDNVVSVTKKGVAVTGDHGRPIVISKDGIEGLDELRHIGPTIQSAVRTALRALPIIKPLRPFKATRKSIPYAYDNVDEFDWDD